jgi:transposase
MALPLYKRYEIIFLHQHPKGPQWGLEKTASYVGCSKPTVVYWVKKYQEDKNLIDQPKSGRGRSTTTAQDEKIVSLAEKEHNITSAEIQQRLEKQGVTVSERTVRRRLAEAGGKYLHELQKPLLTEKHRKKRLQWAKNHRDFDWNRVIFTDESTFQLYRSSRKVWQFGGRRKVFRTVKHPQKVHVWGCFSARGFGKIICFQTNLDAHFMCTIYERGLLASVDELFEGDTLGWILQEDNDPKHRSKIAKKWKEENGVIELPWPSMSPDQNPIENIWRLLKIKISKKKIQTVKGLKGEITKEWNRLPIELASNLVSSMKNRVTSLIEANGDYTMY